MVVYSCDLQAVKAIFFLDGLVDREPLLEHLDNFREVVGGDRSQHSVWFGVWEDALVLIVPRHEDMKERERAEEVGVGSVAGELGQEVVDFEGEPLAEAEDGGHCKYLSFV